MAVFSAMPTIRTHYLDASALVKMLISEEGSTGLRDYLGRHAGAVTTSLCFAETLGALKAKALRNILSTEQYLAACEDLMAHIRGQSLEIDDIGISHRRTFDEVERLAKKYGIDVSDAYQIVTVRRGLYCTLEGDSKPLLITADEKLAQAARGEGLRVWDCLRETAP